VPLLLVWCGVHYRVNHAEEHLMPATATGATDWRYLAACRDLDAEKFFPDGDPSAPAVARQVREALAACAACPVRRQCSEYAAATAQKFGIWGGTTEQERHRERRRRYRRREAA
jgi:WhiB family transcriptional regulator, redox-sensing transcriptional regulator